MPGAKTAVLLKEIDVPTLRAPLGEVEKGEKLRPDWKRSTSKRSPQISDNIDYPTSSTDRLLGLPAIEDLEKGNASSAGDISRAASSEQLGQRTKSDSTHLLISPHQTGHEDIRYALLPGVSSASLFGEDDPILPEDMAHSSTAKSSETPAERDKQLKVRPLPLNASDERATLIPARNRPPGLKATPPTDYRAPPHYGAVDDSIVLTGSRVGHSAATSSDVESKKK